MTSLLIQIFPVQERKTKSNIIGPPPELIHPVGFFDGAASTGKGGAGILIAISKVHSIKIKLGCGSSTNTKAELLALWVFS